MTPMNKTQSNWPSMLRITEVTGLPMTSPPATAANSIDALRTAWDTLQRACRWIQHKRIQQFSSRRMRVAESISLGEKRTISIVVVDGAQYLIGSSSGGVQLLTKLDQPSALASCNEVAS